MQTNEKNKGCVEIELKSIPSFACVDGCSIVYSQGIRLPGVTQSLHGGGGLPRATVDLRCFLIRLRASHFKRWELN